MKLLRIANSSYVTVSPHKQFEAFSIPIEKRPVLEKGPFYVPYVFSHTAKNHIQWNISIGIHDYGNAYMRNKW